MGAVASYGRFLFSVPYRVDQRTCKSPCWHATNRACSSVVSLHVLHALTGRQVPKRLPQLTRTMYDLLVVSTTLIARALIIPQRPSLLTSSCTGLSYRCALANQRHLSALRYSNHAQVSCDGSINCHDCHRPGRTNKFKHPCAAMFV